MAPDIPPICLDASLAAAIALPEPLTPQALHVWQQWLADERPVIAPPHFGVELLSAVRHARVLGRVTPDEEAEGLALCVSEILPSTAPRWPDQAAWHRAWAWALRLQRGNLYDALYLAVAEEVGAEFWTGDGNLTRALVADGSPLPEWVPLVEP